MEQRNIVLMGFMGTGKSTVGRALADRLGYAFVDMDTRIEAREGRAISAIFATDGEAHFRRLERALVQELAAGSGLVVATGGGIVLNPDNVGDFARTGLVVCLRATPAAILARVAHETHRPLLAEGDKLAKISALLAKRQPLYDAIPHQVDTTGRAIDAIVEQVLALRAGARTAPGEPPCRPSPKSS